MHRNLDEMSGPANVTAAWPGGSMRDRSLQRSVVNTLDIEHINNSNWMRLSLSLLEHWLSLSCTIAPSPLREGRPLRDRPLREGPPLEDFEYLLPT
jgi:hypothetical protein